MSQDLPKKKVTLGSQTEPQAEPQVEAVTKSVKSEYEVPKGEEGIFHVEMEPKTDRYDPVTGKKKHISFVQKFHPRDFALQIQPSDAGEPVYSTVGWRINKILYVPADKFLENIKVDIGPTKENAGRKTFIPITEMLVRLDKIIANQPA